VVAEEYSEAYSAARVSNIAALIRSADDNKHVIANHQLNGLRFDHAADPNIDQFAIQYNVTTAEGLHDGMVTAWNYAAGRYGLTMSESKGHGYASRAEVRRKNWACALGGAYVMVIGMDGTTAYNDKMKDCATLKTFFEITDFNTMAPHDELGNSGTWVLADKGRSYIAYRSAAGSFILSGMEGGTYLLRWLDAVSGTTWEELRSVAPGTASFVPPQGIGVEAAVWVTKISDQMRGALPPVLLLLQNQ
jgi:hypothetical protein